MSIYKIIIRHSLLYTAETTVLSQREEQLRTVEKKIIRTILEVETIEENKYQIAMNLGIKELEGEILTLVG